MNIPYSDFYAAEFGNSSNAYEVDAFSSATTSKWQKNGAGQLFEGTFNQPNDDGTGKILGVTYPVAITQTDLDALGNENYDFTPLDSEPEAYKNVIVSDGSVSFSAVQDSTPTTASGASIKLSTNTPWGDYLIDVENAPEIGAIYGALIKTADGKTYAMRHEENIWRGELAWSSGIKTTEPHGNTLSYENFTDLIGATITKVTFITTDGYTTLLQTALLLRTARSHIPQRTAWLVYAYSFRRRRKICQSFGNVYSNYGQCASSLRWQSSYQSRGCIG